MCVALRFGNGFFFSWWHAEVRPALPTLVSILIVWGYLIIMGIFTNQFGFLRGPIIFLVLVPVILFLVSRMGKPEADDFILMLPFIGPLYERFFRPITYYRIDTAQMFQKTVEKAVQDVIEGITTEKGIRPLTELERKPVMRDFFKK